MIGQTPQNYPGAFSTRIHKPIPGISPNFRRTPLSTCYQVVHDDSIALELHSESSWCRRQHRATAKQKNRNEKQQKAPRPFSPKSMQRKSWPQANHCSRTHHYLRALGKACLDVCQITLISEPSLTIASLQGATEPASFRNQGSLHVAIVMICRCWHPHLLVA
ncbi:unnamed protein product [Periconia digitata]|uniref:Uncharacterized protein n=1 Tax=Periconia digitata TaxID=1303443 RepID=A0A9W4U2G3_9PLEO|nr:unnamed protein product [Periconia digitata]